jgi:hypothetical protein
VLLALGAAVVGTGLAGCAPAAERGSAGSVDAVSAATVTAMSPAAASVRGGTRLTLHGSGLGSVTAVRIAGTDAPVTAADETRLVVTAPASTDFASGRTTAHLLAGSAIVGRTTLAYAPVDGVDRQLQYLLQHWKDYNPAYQPLGTTDCVDFASQSLLARGWRQQDDWTHAEQVAESGGAWISSTLFRDFMRRHPELGTALTDDERAKVRLGDVVQFDWDGTGDRDHTGVVTRITREGDRIRIGFAGHTLDSDYRDVDDAITKDHPGGAAFYWSLA